MLPISKELQGQKAIPFMEWCIKNAVLTLVTQNGQIRENYFEIPEYFLNFFNQSFTPEMLTEYFEGKNEQHLRILTLQNGWYKLDLENEYKLGNENFYNTWRFKSLNDLLTLCNLAGVNLTWKGTGNG